jgi:hypothetical protein
MLDSELITLQIKEIYELKELINRAIDILPTAKAGGFQHRETPPVSSHFAEGWLSKPKS